MKKFCMLFLLLNIFFMIDFNMTADEYKRLKIKLIDESSNDKTIYEFRNNLLKIIENKDSESLIKLFTIEHFHPGFGGGTFEDFLNKWHLLSDPENSEIWYELGEVVRLGFYYSDVEKGYVAPSIFSKIPQYIYDKFAPFEWGVITENKVNIRKKPGVKSNIINQLSYEFVLVDRWGAEDLVYETINNEEFPWYKVYLYNGESGYVYGKYLRSIGNYRLYIKKYNGVWKIKGFFDGL